MSHLRMLAKMGRMSGYSEADLTGMLARHGTPKLVRDALREAFAVPQADLDRQKMDLAHAIVGAEGVIEASDGKNVDARGFDEADRLVESVAHTALGLKDSKDSA
jgi:hypothetical protein